jgi:hypothetical protein
MVNLGEQTKNIIIKLGYNIDKQTISYMYGEVGYHFNVKGYNILLVIGKNNCSISSSFSNYIVWSNPNKNRINKKWECFIIKLINNFIKNQLI